MKFNLKHVNWLAQALDHNAPIPEPVLEFNGGRRRFYSPNSANEIIATFVRAQDRPYTGLPDAGAPDATMRSADEYPSSPSDLEENVQELRRQFEDSRWLAAFIPPITDDGEQIDINLGKCLEQLSFEYDRYLMRKGLVLPPIESVEQRSVMFCSNVHSAMQTVFSCIDEWPGVVIWLPSGEAAFFSMKIGGRISSPAYRSEAYREYFEERVGWIFSRLCRGEDANLQSLKKDYDFEYARRGGNEVCHILHISDVHMGSVEARMRFEHLENLVKLAIRNLQPDSVIPVVSGDLIDSPDRELSQKAQRFIDFLHSACGNRPMIVLGNHDVRKKGFGPLDFSLARQIDTSPISRYPQHQLTLVGFDSNEGNYLASGRVSQEQLLRVADLLDEDGVSDCPFVVGVVHHHPLPVEQEEWQQIPFLQRMFRKIHEPTVAFENGRDFLRFARARSFIAVLHGHKHVPRIVCCPDTKMPVFGCGSSVGKIETADGSIRLSINLVTIDRDSLTMTCRLLMETEPGWGLKSHRDEVFTIRPIDRVQTSFYRRRRQK
jgi:3',5'-cyclic AMP phosphodiesterase CpdA